MVKKKLLRLDLGCGDRKAEGFVGVDKFKTPSTDMLVDLLKFPWPWKAGAVDEVHCSHFFEHVPAKLRPKFMDELYRVMKKGAKATIVCPCATSTRATQDFTHEWPPISPESFLYFNKEWRVGQKLTHGAYAMKCDFDFGYGWAIDAELAARSDTTQQFALRHYYNAASDVQITLTKR